MAHTDTINTNSLINITDIMMTIKDIDKKIEDHRKRTDSSSVASTWLQED